MIKIETAQEKLIEIGQLFYQRGWSLATSSNYSVVIETAPLRLLITGSGFDKGSLKREHFVLVDEKGERLDKTQPQPSAETLLHVVLARAGAGAILHTHSIWGTLISETFAKEKKVTIAGYEMLKALQGITTHEEKVEITIFPNTQKMDIFSKEIETRLKEKSLRYGFLMSGHGLYTWGADLDEAKRQVEALEFLFEVLVRKKSLSPG